MTPPQNKPGRPRVEPSDRAPSVYLHVTVSATLYDKAYVQARAARQTVPEWIRQTLTDATTKGGPDR
jgi:hypothetical protein